MVGGEAWLGINEIYSSFKQRDEKQILFTPFGLLGGGVRIKISFE